MVWIVATVLMLLVAISLRFLGGLLRNDDSRDAQSIGTVLGYAWWAPTVVMVSVHTGMNSLQQVQAGHVGVVFEFGAIVGQLSEGFHLVPPWRNLETADIRVQRHPFKKLETFSKETQTVFVDASLNIRIKPEAIQELYRHVGVSYYETVVVPRVYQNFKDELVKYSSIEIAPNRETIRKEVRRRLEAELSTYSIEVEDLLLDNIDFRDEFEQAIENKQIATQRALEEEQKVIVERHRAQQALERARGEGSALLAVAEKQADANRRLTESLNPLLVQYTMVQKLSDKIRVIILPAGQNFILDGNTLNPNQPVPPQKE